VSDLGLTLRQVRFTNKAFWRNPASAFFTFAFPLMFLVIFTSLLGSGKAEVAPGKEIIQSTYYVASMAAFAVITACYTNVAISVTFNRDAGILKRTRGTPLPAWAYLAARVIHALIVSIILVVITVAFGAAFYHADIPSGVELLQFLAVLGVGAMSFAALGLALTSIIPNADASPPIVNASILPLLFLSGTFFPITEHAPAWVKLVGRVFPVKHFTDAMLASFYGKPAFTFAWSDVLVIAVWGLVGLALAARFFSWEPRR
jgi:ABC-2 type transport system permease protein